jgi:hypothetical protein
VYRLQGSGDFIHWWAADSLRFGEARSPKGYVMITVRDDFAIKCFTCEDAGRLIGLIVMGRGEIIRE